MLKMVLGVRTAHHPSPVTTTSSFLTPLTTTTTKRVVFALDGDWVEFPIFETLEGASLSIHVLNLDLVCLDPWSVFVLGWFNWFNCAPTCIFIFVQSYLFPIFLFIPKIKLGLSVSLLLVQGLLFWWATVKITRILAFL